MSLNRSTSAEILETIDEQGAATPGYVIDETGKNERYIRRQLTQLVEADLLERPNRGMYRLTRQGELALEHKHLIGTPDLFDAVQTP